MPATSKPAAAETASTRMRLARALRTVTQCSHGVLRAQTEKELLSEVCRIAVMAGRYRFVWIGLAEHDSELSVRPAAWYGHEDGFLDSVTERWSKSPEGMGPVGRTIRSGRPTVVQNTAAESRFLPWREQALQRRYRSAVALPLKHDAVTQGALVIYSPRVEDFGKQEVELLSHLAASISYHGFELLRANEAARHAGEQLRMSEKRYRSLVLAGAHIVWSVTAADGLTLFTLNWEEYTGRPAPAGAQMGWLEHVHPDDRARAAEAWLKALHDQLPTYAEFRLRAADGSYRHFLAQMVPVRADDGSIREWVGTYSDITARKLAEQEREFLLWQLRERVKEARCLYSIMAAIEHMEDTDSLLHRVSELIPAGWQYPEITCSRLTLGGREFCSQGFVQTSWKQSAPILIRGSEAGRVEVFHTQERPPAAEGPFLQEERDLVTAIGREMGMALERRQGQERAQHAQKMESLGRLAGGISHDFNNILSVIIGYADQLAEKTPAEDPNSRRIQEIGKAARRAVTLTRQLLTFSHNQVVAPVVLDLNAVVGGLEPMLHRLLEANITLSFRLQGGAKSVLADAGQIEQAVLNLVINARDAMAQGGSITVSTENVVLDQARARELDLAPGPYVLLAVADTGGGMDAPTLAHVFEPFFTTKKSGTGLGLAIVHGISRQSGGSVEVKSRKDRGSTFRLYFPALEARPEAAPAERTETPPAQGSETVLVVEDQEILRGLIAESLEGRGYRVLVAADGDAALRVAAAAPSLDALVTDVALCGDMNGKDVALRLLQTRPQLPVVFISGYAARDDLQSVSAHAAFLLKPFPMGELAVTLRRLIDGCSNGA